MSEGGSRPVWGDSEVLATIQWTWARLLLDALAGAGVREVVISPGSRSTPFVLAAHRQPALRITDILDERSAGFYALGQAKASGEPSLLLSTSGSAGAHYLPAVMEASASHTPLLVLTADRPTELHGCGANQAADQLKLFGAHVRGFFHLGPAEAAGPALRALRRTAAQAVSLTRSPVPGPVHLNAPARKPLEPARTDADARRGELERLLERRVAPVARVAEPVPALDPEAVREIAERLAGASRPLIIAGPAPISTASTASSALRRLATTARVPLAAEATSQLRFGGDRGETAPAFAYFDPVYQGSTGRTHLRPDLVLRFGGAPASGGLLRLLDEIAEGEDSGSIVVAPYGWPDPQSAADLLVRADPAALAAAVVERLAAWPAPGGSSAGADRSAGAESDSDRQGWLDEVARADRVAEEAIARVLAAAADELTEGAVAREVPVALGREALLALGNSLPVRQVDAWCPPGGGPARVLSQRGLSGIDGLISGAAGAAATSGRPTALLIGDVSFFHDLNGLLPARGLELPFVVVVINNQGGRLFEELPIAGRAEFADAMPHFLTPPDASVEHAAAVYGHRFASETTVSGFRSSLQAALATDGCTVLEARVAPGGAARQNARVRRDVEASLGR